MKSSKFTKQALRDIASAANYYDRQEDGLGDKFVDRVYEALRRIESNPQAYALAYKILRKCNVRRFPYSLWFEIRPDDSLVVACLHHKRDFVIVRERAAGVIEIYKPDPKQS